MKDAERRLLTVAYVHPGETSGVRLGLCPELRARGHRVVEIQGTGPLEWRPRDGARRLGWALPVHLGAAALRFGRHALRHRWNTPFAFDVHSRHAERLIRGAEPAPDVVLQHGALFSPGRPPALPYVLYLDHTRRAALEVTGLPGHGQPPAVDYGRAWYGRETAVYRQAAALCPYSRRVAESLVRHYGMDPSSIEVAGAGANVFPNVPSRRDNGQTLAFVGRDFDRKGGRVLLRALARLRRDWPRLQLLIVGPVEPLQLPRGAIQVGALPFRELPDLLSLATIFVLPTLLEPFGLAFLDAMACALPCVGTDVESVPEIVDDGVTGLLVPPGDDSALARAVDALLRDPARARRMGELGRERVAARFLWRHTAERIEKALLSAAGRPEGGG